MWKILTAALRRAWARAVLILTARPPARTPRQIRAEIANIVWYHQIDMGHGIITPGLDNTLERISAIKLPDDLSGQDVLDVGGTDRRWPITQKMNSITMQLIGGDQIHSQSSTCSKPSVFTTSRESISVPTPRTGRKAARCFMHSGAGATIRWGHRDRKDDRRLDGSHCRRYLRGHAGRGGNRTAHGLRLRRGGVSWTLGAAGAVTVVLHRPSSPRPPARSSAADRSGTTSTAAYRTPRTPPRRRPLPVEQPARPSAPKWTWRNRHLRLQHGVRPVVVSRPFRRAGSEPAARALPRVLGGGQQVLERVVDARRPEVRFTLERPPDVAPKRAGCRRRRRCPNRTRG